MLDQLQQALTTVASIEQIPLIECAPAPNQRALDKAWTKDPAYEFTPDIIHPNSPGHAANGL